MTRKVDSINLGLDAAYIHHSTETIAQLEQDIADYNTLPARDPRVLRGLQYMIDYHYAVIAAATAHDLIPSFDEYMDYYRGTSRN